MSFKIFTSYLIMIMFHLLCPKRHTCFNKLTTIYNPKPQSSIFIFSQCCLSLDISFYVNIYNIVSIWQLTKDKHESLLLFILPFILEYFGIVVLYILHFNCILYRVTHYYHFNCIFTEILQSCFWLIKTWFTNAFTHKSWLLPLFFLPSPHDNSTFYHNYKSHIKTNQPDNKNTKEKNAFNEWVVRNEWKLYINNMRNNTDNISRSVC